MALAASSSAVLTSPSPRREMCPSRPIDVPDYSRLGGFLVNAVNYDATGRVVSLNVSAEQHCDDEEAPVRATVRLAW